MRPRWVIARKELAGVFTERTILLAVVIQVIVAGFSSFLVVGLSALVDPSAFPTGTQTVVALNPDALHDAALVKHLSDAGLHVVAGDDENATWTLFTSHKADAAVFLRHRDSTNDSTFQPLNLTVVLPEADIRTTLTLVQVKNGLETYERDLRAAHQPELQFHPLYVDNAPKAGSYSFVYSLLIPLLVFLPVVLSGALCADSLTEEVQRKTLPLLLASPATPADIVEGKLLANVAVAPMLAAAWFLLLGLNGIHVPPVGAILILVLSAAIAYILGLLACAIALATRDRNKAHVLYASAMFLLLGFSLALPVSPVNAVALLAAGSPGVGTYGLVAAFVAVALVGSLALRITLRRTQQWMAAGAA